AATMLLAAFFPSWLAPIWSNSFIYDHPRDRLAILLLFRRIDAMASRIDGKAVNHFLYWKIFQFLVEIRALRLEHGDEPTGTSNVDSPQAWVKLHNIRTGRHRKVCDRFVSIECEHGECPVSAAEKKCAVMFRIDSHSVIKLAAIHRISSHDRIA